MFPPITLTTDFGLDDPFVGVMKGVILNIAPEARIVDLCHTVEPQNIVQAAWILKSSLPYFPLKTIHVVVVDPGVGSERRPLAAECGGQQFLGPDNGVLLPALDSSAQFYELSNPRYFLENISSTFHGRDIFAPVSAWISRGTSMAFLGKRIIDPVDLVLPQPKKYGKNLIGEVISIDRFGNMISNISRDELESAFGSSPSSLEIRSRLKKISGLRKNYTQCKKGKEGALINSWNLLEIFVGEGDAARRWKGKIGDKVTVSIKEKKS